MSEEHISSIATDSQKDLALDFDWAIQIYLNHSILVLVV